MNFFPRMRSGELGKSIVATDKFFINGIRDKFSGEEIGPLILASSEYGGGAVASTPLKYMFSQTR